MIFLWMTIATVLIIGFVLWIHDRAYGLDGMITLLFSIIGSIIALLMIWVFFPLIIYRQMVDFEVELKSTTVNGQVVYSITTPKSTINRILLVNDYKNDGLQKIKKVKVTYSYGLYGTLQEVKVKTLDGQELFK